MEAFGEGAGGRALPADRAAWAASSSPARGTQAQQKRILPAIVEGKRTLAFAHTEPGARYDLRQVGLQARRKGDG